MPYTEGTRAFQVDLRGVVDLLSRHLYSSPRVYVRELLQNACDAIIARRAGDPMAPGRIRVEVGPEAIRVHDTGIGLTEDEVHTLLATIGRSSKRDELGFRAPRVPGAVRDRAAVGVPGGRRDPRRVAVGLGRPDGLMDRAVRRQLRRRHHEFPEGRARHHRHPASPPGRGRVDFRPDRNRIGRALRLAAARRGDRRRHRDLRAGAPWQVRHASPLLRREALISYGRELFGFSAFDVIDLEVPEAGLTGVAFVVPHPANPGARDAHRVYLKGMLLSEKLTGLLPDWAFFVRVVVDAAELRPTASREALYDDDLLEHTRDALGAQLREWLVKLAATDPARLRGFLRLHHLGREGPRAARRRHAAAGRPVARIRDRRGPDDPRPVPGPPPARPLHHQRRRVPAARRGLRGRRAWGC